MKIPDVSRFSKRRPDIKIEKIADDLSPSFENIILSQKERFVLIKEVEKTVRQSEEYREYIKYLKDNFEMDKCAFMPRVTNENTPKIRIEIHHEPFTLYSITDTVLTKFEATGAVLDVMDMANEIAMLHYTNMVGLIPLSETVHEITHSGRFFIPLYVIKGNFRNFIKEYDLYIPDDVKLIIREKIRLTKELANVDFNILETKYIYLDVDGVPELKDINELLAK